MLFNSLPFILAFLPITWLGFVLLGARDAPKLALVWLVAASLFFYGWWNPAYLLLLCGSVAVNYLIGEALLKRPSKPLLGVGVALNLAAIGYYKYGMFVADNLVTLNVIEGNLERIVLPLAISFFTFQQIAYLVDAYRKEVKPGGIVAYALFVTFFPQLIAGPIVHHSETMPQFARRETFRPNLDNLAVGVSFFILGLFKKVVLADTAATYATPLFAAAEAGLEPTLFEAWGGALAYTFQLYFDFSGYSDMAIGLARMFNIRLPFNFDSPYKSINITEFWRRWHMTLSRFLRDYLYIPLGGSRKGPSRRYVNLMTTMLLGGLWHGAGWTFVVWGGLHGVYLCVNHGWHALRRSWGHDLSRSTFIGRLLGGAVTFLAVVVAWVFFRAESFDAAWRILAGMIGLNGALLAESYARLFGPALPLVEALGLEFGLRPNFQFHGVPQVALLLALAGIAFLLPNSQQWIEGGQPLRRRVGGSLTRLVGLAAFLVPRWRPGLVHGTVFGAVLAYVLLGMYAQTPSEFLYFQF